jgi:quinohemoprotein ethanol dehydrogenase
MTMERTGTLPRSGWKALAPLLLLSALSLPLGACSDRGAALTDGSDWPSYGGADDENHYSPLDDINQANIGKLGLAWSHDLPPSASVVSAPVAVGGILYTATGLSVVRAFEGDTGKLLWEYDPTVAEVAGDTLKGSWGVRGLAYADGRLFVGTLDGRLIAIDAKSGRPDWSVQTTTPGDGRYITGAPRVFGGRVIIGHGGADYAPVRGYVTAYDTRTGGQLWRFYTVPGNPAVEKDETTRLAAKSWTGEWWNFGGGGTVWNAMTYDPEFDRIYLGTGNGAPWNRDIRSPGGGDNLFLCSIVAIDAKTGKYIWHYQTVPGEQWDMNSAMDIQLATLSIAGKPRRVILHAPKNGFFYVIDREHGRLISAEPFAKVTWASGIDNKTGRPIENPGIRSKTDPIVIWPSGTLGAHNWYPMAYSPKQRLVYIPTTELPGSYTAKTIDATGWHYVPRSRLNTGYDARVDFHGAPPADAKLPRPARSTAGCSPPAAT